MNQDRDDSLKDASLGTAPPGPAESPPLSRDESSANAPGWWSRFIACLVEQEKWTSTLRNWAIITGIGVALISVIVAWVKIRQEDSIFRKRVSIEALYSIREESFIKAFSRLKTVKANCKEPTGKEKEVLEDIYHKNDDIMNTNCLIDDINLVSEKLSYISQMYTIGDREIIIGAIYLKIKEFSKIIKKLSSLIGPVESEFQRINDDYLNYILGEIAEKIDWKDEKKGRKF